MESHELVLNIFSQIVAIQTNSKALKELLIKDFSFFYQAQNNQERADFKLNFYLGEIPADILPDNLKAISQNTKSITYEYLGTRYNDYHRKALSVYQFDREIGAIYSPHLSKLHELSYLLILSRVGKKMDLNGLHRLHAFCIGFEDELLIGLMPSKGGKSSYLMKLLRFDQVDILSDDTPIIGINGKVHAFPLRVGSDNLYGHPIAHEYLYSIDREHYGKKRLIDIRGLKNKIGHDQGKVILFKGVRVSGKRARVKSCSKFKLLMPVVKDMVIGHGTPIILEYFWELGFADFLRKTKIAILRMVATISLLFRAKTYIVELGNDLDANTNAIKSLFSNHDKLKRISNDLGTNQKPNPSTYEGQIS